MCMHMDMSGIIGLYTRKQRPDEGVECLSYHSPTYFLKTGSLNKSCFCSHSSTDITVYMTSSIYDTYAIYNI